ncbi:MAG: response regulator transcription factor [Proteobacteria bacterium]|nr:response regulator transcription factor [Pseudomonadota bacterium]
MKLLLIEDDQIIADFVIKGMQDAGHSIEHANDGVSGQNLALSGQYDLAIVDIMLPELDGLSIISKLRAEDINMPIIILSAKRSVDERVSGLKSGSDDYLTKPFSINELQARVEALLRRSIKYTDSSTLSIHDLTLDLISRKASRDDKTIDLQPKEFALLEYLVRNRGHVVSKAMIMEHVWNYNFDPQTNIVEARISNLRDKVDKPFDKPLIETVRGLGYTIK